MSETETERRRGRGQPSKGRPVKTRLLDPVIERIAGLDHERLGAADTFADRLRRLILLGLAEAERIQASGIRD